MSEILISKHGGPLGSGFTKQEITESFVHGGRRTQIKGYKSPASWIGDLSDLKLCILLCSYCRANFDYRKHHYRKHFSPDHSGKTSGFMVNGMCDACKERTENIPGGGEAYVHESLYDRVCMDPNVARRNARASAKAWSVSTAITRSR